MADVHSKETRSYNMSQVKSKNTKPELLVRKFLHSHGLRYRLHVKDLPGKPDIVLPKYKTVILIHGCFWHGHENCKKASIPETRKDWWEEKIGKNSANDNKAENALLQSGWRVIKIWECELKKTVLENTLNQLINNFKSSLISD